MAMLEKKYLVVSEEKVFEWKVNDGRTDKRTTDATIIYRGNKTRIMLLKQNNILREQDS